MASVLVFFGQLGYEGWWNVMAGKAEKAGGLELTAMQQEETAGVVLFVVIKVERLSDEIQAVQLVEDVKPYLFVVSEV